MPGDMERSRWAAVSAELEGKIVSLDELKRLFPETEELSVIDLLEDKERYAVYGRKSKKIRFLSARQEAYRCKSCNTLMIGSPVIEDDTSIHDGVPLTGREGWDASCRKCYAHLDEETYAMS